MALYASIRLRPRKAKTLLLFMVLSPVLVGWVGLVIDGGLLMAGQRQAQNAADAAALAGAMNMMQGGTITTARAAANPFLASNGLSNAPALVSGTSFNIPPKQGPFKGNSQYVEVIVTNPVQTYFIQAVGASSTANVTARAVAGYEAVTAGEGGAVLDPRFRHPGRVRSRHGRGVPGRRPGSDYQQLARHPLPLFTRRTALGARN